MKFAIHLFTLNIQGGITCNKTNYLALIILINTKGQVIFYIVPSCPFLTHIETYSVVQHSSGTRGLPQSISHTFLKLHHFMDSVQSSCRQLLKRARNSEQGSIKVLHCWVPKINLCWRNILHFELRMHTQDLRDRKIAFFGREGAKALETITAHKL